MLLISSSRRVAFFLPLLAAACGLSGSGGEGGDDSPPPRIAISSQGAALTAQENAEQALRGVLNSGAFLAESQGVADGLSSLSGSSESCNGTALSQPCPDDGSACPEPVIVEECTTVEGEVTTDDLIETRQEMYDALEEFITLLRDEVFISENLEEETETHATYRLPAELFCKAGSSDSGGIAIVTVDNGEESPPSEVAALEPEPLDAEPVETAESEPDQECLDDFERLEPRLRLSSPADRDVDVELLLTADQRNPITIQLYDDRLGVVLDLGELKATVESVGEELEGVSDLSGEVGLELVRHAATDYSVRMNVLSALHFTGGEEGEQIELTLAPSSPSLEVRLDGEARTITGSYDYGAFNLVAPLSAFFGEEGYDDLGNPLPPKTYTGDIDAVLGGLNGSLTFDGNQDVLRLEGLGLGDVSTTIKHAGNTILQLDVNPDDGRRFDLELVPGDADDATITLSPTLDLRLMLAFSHLADQVDDLEQFLLNDSLRLWFEGDAAPSVHVAEEGIEVLSSTLHLESTASPDASLSVSPGMCLLGAEESEEAPASLVEAFVAGACE